MPRGAHAVPRRFVPIRGSGCNCVVVHGGCCVRCAGGGPALGLHGWGTSALLNLGCRAACTDAASINMAVSKISSSGSVQALRDFAWWFFVHETNIPEVAGQSQPDPHHRTLCVLPTPPGGCPPDPPLLDCADAGDGRRTGDSVRTPRRPWRPGAGPGPAFA